MTTMRHIVISILLTGSAAFFVTDQKTEAQAVCPKNMVCIPGEQPVPDIGPLPDQVIPAMGPREELGRLLFCDHRLSDDDAYACAQCHQPTHGFAEARPISVGFGGGKASERNAPSLINIRDNADSAHPVLTWDGRVPSGLAFGYPWADPLVEQILLPVKGGDEMHMTYEKIDWKWNNTWPNHAEGKAKRAKYKTDFPDSHRLMYREMFKKAKFKLDNGMRPEDIYVAIAAFERTIVSNDSPFDLYMKAFNIKYPSGLSNVTEYENFGVTGFKKPEWQGMMLFRGKARCILCHNGPNFTDYHFYNVGWPADYVDGHWKYRLRKTADPPSKHRCEGNNSTILEPVDCGRQAILSKKDKQERKEMKGAFKTPSLRDVSKTWPYMHDGGLLRNFTGGTLDEKGDISLNEVLDFFNKGGGENNPYMTPKVKTINLNEEELKELKSFLLSLTLKPLDLDAYKLTSTQCPWPARP